MKVKTILIVWLCWVAVICHAQTIRTCEYWVDANQDGRTSVVISSDTLSFSIPLSAEKEGVHFMNIRCCDTSNVWGPLKRFMFYVSEKAAQDTISSSAGYEYWVDNSCAQRQTIQNEGASQDISLTLTELAEGVHFFNVRSVNQQGVWCPLKRFMFYVAGTSEQDSVSSASGYEYWIDDSCANRVSVEDGGTSYEMSVPLAGMSSGVHFFNCRSVCANELFGPVKRFLFYVSGSAQDAPSSQICGYEYWLDTDCQTRHYVTSSEEDISVSLPIDSLTEGIHFFNLRTVNQNGLWGPVKRFLFYHSTTPKEVNGSPIVKYRYAFNSLTTWIDVGETKELTITDNIIDIPNPLTFAKVPDGVFTVNSSGDSIAMKRTSKVVFSIQFANKQNSMSAPDCYEFDMNDSTEKAAIPLAVQKSVTLDKLPAGDFQAVKMVIDEQRTYYLKASQSCCIKLFKDGKEYIQEITPSQLLNTYAVSLAPATYHAVVYDMVKDTTYTEDQLALRLMLTNNYVPTPEIAYVDSLVTITCAQEGAAIFYTLDGTDPTKQSSQYTAPFKLDHNATIKALATYTDLADSYVATYKVDTYATEAPSIQFANLKVYMSCATEKAEIHYTLDGTTPTLTSTRYSEPFTQNENCTIKAMAQRDGYNASSVTTYELDVVNVKCIAPVIEVKDNTWMTMTTLTEDASIYYTSDGTTPTRNSTKYEETITLTNNARYRAVAVKNGLLDSPISEYDVNWFKASLPAFSFSEGTLTITCTTPGAVIHYEIGGTEPTESSAVYSEPIILTDNNVVKAMAVAAGFINSDVATYHPNTFTCDTVTITYDGHSVRLATATSDAVIYYTLDGTDPGESSFVYKEKFKLSGLCTVKAVATKPQMNNSAVSTYNVTAFYDGGAVSVNEEGSLSKAFEWCGTSGLSTLDINGTMGTKDFDYLRTVKSIQYLDVSGVRPAGDSLPSESFKGMNLVSVSLPSQLTSCGKRLFERCKSLAAIQWNADIELDSEALDGFTNPNLLLYVNLKSYAPAGIQNVVANGTAAQIVLTDVESGNNNFHCPKAFTATAISYSHTYSMKTVVGTTQGYEALALPFTVQEIAHQEKGIIAPFAAYESGKQKPFWLYALTANGFEKASSIEANKPYIISMPNNDEYIDSYILAGKVTFSASNATVQETDALTSDVYTSFHFTPCYLHSDKNNILALNINEAYKGNPEGSIFVPGLRDAKPFEAYVTFEAQSTFGIVDAGFVTALDELPTLASTLGIWTEGHTLYIHSRETLSIEIFSATGFSIRNVDLVEGKNVIDDLPSGIYLIAGIKVSVR